MWRQILKVRDLVLRRFGNVHNQLRAIANCHSNGKMKISSIYNTISQSSAAVPWAKTVWGDLHYPKHSIILWLATLSKLLTKDRLCRMGILEINQCVLCADSVSQPFSSYVWINLMAWMKFTWRSCCWSQVMRWYSNNLRGLGFMKKLKRMMLSGAIYWIWKERNLRIFQQRTRSPNQLIKEIKISLLLKALNDDVPEYLREEVAKL
ncbi:uncharacterized protein LOC109836698 [Asparagus officinalis]|uniref:uncharacterized protein LOC109836698 n=1 Tax=Asparagus officinalis TaxID=4686 RepID=UPI00098E8263|nr:uncharacterized protein LOC109836698 [Asparagus officinalis]